MNSSTNFPSATFWPGSHEDGSDPFLAAVLATRTSMIFTDPRQSDNPIVFVNDAFCELTGYTRQEILGKNCRFLQGDGTDQSAVAKIRDAIARGVPVDIDLQNQKKSGEQFWNRLFISPVFSADGDLRYFFASQFDLSDEREHAANLDDALRRNALVLDALIRSSSEVRYRINADWSGLYQLSGGNFLADTSADNYDWFNQYIPQNDRLAVRTAINLAIRTRSTYDIEHQVYRVDGSVGWAASRAVPILNEQGEIVEWYGAASDITDRRNAEAALRELNTSLEKQIAIRTRELDRAWRLSQDLLAVMLPDGTLKTVNPMWFSLLGYPDADLFGKNFIDLSHPDDQEALARVLGSLRNKTLVKPYDSRFRHKDGSYRWVAWTAAYEDGKVYASGRDGTLEKKYAANLRESEIRAATFFSFTDDYLFLIRFGEDGQARFEDINPACEKVMGLMRTEVIGRTVASVLPADIAQDIIRYALLSFETRQPQLYAADREYQKGQRIIIEGRVIFVDRADSGGNLVLFSGHDVTAQRNTEEALRQSQKMEAVGQLTGGLAHDFNNLLAGISGSLELMQTRMRQGKFNDLERYMTAAQGASRRAATLTHRLLAFSRRQTLDPKPTDVTRLAMGMQELIQRTVGPAILVEVVGTTSSWPALVDAPQLENALLNLCINARDAMPSGGTITIETANKWMDERAAHQHNMSEGQYLSLAVTDTGTGMSAEVIARAFEPFFTTKPIGEGTGLGLSMIYGFAQQSGGQVRIYSEVRQGTTVCIYLPRYYGAPESDIEIEQTTQVPRSLAGETVLVVDDEPTVRMLITDILEDLGYASIEAGDSATAFKVLQSDVRIDLLITDVGLPGGMNGRQMADAARACRPGLKVLFITGYAENAIVGNGTLPPGMSVLTKPFPMDVMAARIRLMIEEGEKQARRH